MKKISNDTVLLIFIAVIFLIGIKYSILDSDDIILIDAKNLTAIEESRNEYDNNLIDEIYINGYKAHKDNNTDRWLCELSGKTLGAEALNITYNGRLPGVRLAVLRNDSLSIEDNEPLILIAYTHSRYKTYEMHFTTLPVMELAYSGYISKTEDTAAVFEGHPGKIHLRGATTLEYPKKAYKITLDEDHSFLDLRKDDDWILYPAYNDQDRVRNVFSSNLWYESCAGNNGFGINNGCLFRYVELFINGDYSGLYALGYKPDQKQFSIKKGEYLFSKISWAETGYELQGSKTKHNESTAREALQEPYRYDVQSNTDLWLFVNFIAGFDNAGKNYFIALKKSDDSYTAVTCPWDMDLTWGNYYKGKDPNGIGENIINPDTPCVMVEGYINRQMKENPTESAELLRERYISLRDNYWSDENMNNLIDEYEKQIFGSGAYKRDVAIWPESNHHEDSIGLAEFREYVLSRAHWMDLFMESLS